MGIDGGAVFYAVFGTIGLVGLAALLCWIVYRVTRGRR